MIHVIKKKRLLYECVARLLYNHIQLPLNRRAQRYIMVPWLSSDWESLNFPIPIHVEKETNVLGLGGERADKSTIELITLHSQIKMILLYQ